MSRGIADRYGRLRASDERMSEQHFTRDVFTEGDYPDIFRPDDGDNPFRNLYAAKRRLVVDTVLAQPAGRVLDLGGGPGRMAVPLARRHVVTLADISEEMLARARAAAARASVPAPALRTVRLDAGAPLPFPDDSFDIAIAIDLVCHLPEPVIALSELRRVVTRGGMVLVETTNRVPLWMLRYPSYAGWNPVRFWHTWRAGGVLPEWIGTVHHHRRQEFRALLIAAGLRPVEEHSLGPRLAPKHFLAVCRPHWEDEPAAAAEQPRRQAPASGRMSRKVETAAHPRA